MPRPYKRRRICGLPVCRGFDPVDQEEVDETIRMTLDEYEAIRLIDLEDLSQAECAQRMQVARTTAQAVYNSARRKLSVCLAYGLPLRIQGGDYELCPGGNEKCHYKFCRTRISERNDGTMKIAVTFENGEIFQHFGHTEQFKIYEVEDGKVTSAAVQSTNGQGHGALAGLLREIGADTLICGGIGGGARKALQEAGIQLYAGVSGDADKAVDSLLAGTLVQNTAATCDHHGHEHHGEDCGHHGHGHHGEGCGHHEGGCGEHGCH